MSFESSVPTNTATITPPSGARETALPASRRAHAPRVWWRLVRGVLMVCAGYWLLCVVLLGAYRFVAPPITGVQLQRRIEARLGRERYRPQKTFVPYARIPNAVVHAVIVAEDGRFLRHWGYDFEEMRDAGTDALQGEGLRGASTITQQLMKNLFGCACRNPVRKVYDLALALPAEILLGKERILELYLNNVEWGDGVFGVEAAAQQHYGVHARDLSRTQAAGLAALLPNPLRRTTQNTADYRAEILRRMVRRGW